LYRNDWDSLSFNKKPDYYDIWALSIRPYVFSYLHFNDVGSVLSNTKKYITGLLQKVPANGLLKCSSAFNGFAIYRMSKFLNCNYDGRIRLDLIPKNYLARNIQINKSTIKTDLVEDCEHRAFHIEAINKNGARIRISPEILF
jgi:hypothetical protein